MGRIDTIANRLKIASKKRGIKQAELCLKTGIPKSAMSQYFSNAFEPKQDRIYLLAKALNVSEAWLMGYDVPMERETKNPATESIELTDAELKLIELFRIVPEDKQALVLQMIEVALKNL